MITNWPQVMFMKSFSVNKIVKMVLESHYKNMKLVLESHYKNISL